MPMQRHNLFEDHNRSGCESCHFYLKFLMICGATLFFSSPSFQLVWSAFLHSNPTEVCYS